MSCICTFTEPGSVYPVLNPNKINGPGPYQGAYGFAWDLVEVKVEEDDSLGPCQMRVGLQVANQITWAKDILAWNYCKGDKVASVATQDADKGPHFMLIEKGDCSSGTDTLLLRKMMAFRQMTGLYVFRHEDFWVYWGGKKVTVTWDRDDVGTGV
jgi:hypothetical protein